METKNPALVPFPRSYAERGDRFFAAVLELSAQAAFVPQLRALRDAIRSAFGDTVLAPLSSAEEFAYFEKNRAEGSELWGGNFRPASAPAVPVRLEAADRGSLGYTLRAGADGIILRASCAEGAAAACACLLQLLHLGWEGWRFFLPACDIADEPVLAWRGFMLDSARHFIPADALKRVLDLAWLYRLNRLHWHLTDDHGWRVELLNTPGAVGAGSTRPGGDPHRNGYYTQDEIRELVAFAADRGITVVPELDLPGHVQSVLAGHPELACTPGPHAVRTEWGISDDVLCMGNPASIDFALAAWDEVCSLFPGPYVHIGGDECPTVRWEACPRCAAKKAELGLADWVDLHGRFMAVVGAHLEAKGKTVFGWDEVLDSALPNCANVVHWRRWLPDQGRRALAAGRDLIVCPFSPYYFDFVQTEDRTATPGLAYKVDEASTLRRVYEFDPFDGYAEDDLSPSRSGGRGRFLGIQGNAWTEYIRDPRRLEYMLFPRLAAIAETAWNGRLRAPYEVFRERLSAGHCGGGRTMLGRLGVNYCPAEFPPRP